MSSCFSEGSCSVSPHLTRTDMKTIWRSNCHEIFIKELWKLLIIRKLQLKKGICLRGKCFIVRQRLKLIRPVKRYKRRLLSSKIDQGKDLNINNFRYIIPLDHKFTAFVKIFMGTLVAYSVFTNVF